MGAIKIAEIAEIVQLETAAELEGSLGSVSLISKSGKECKSGGYKSLVKGGRGLAL